MWRDVRCMIRGYNHDCKFSLTRRGTWHALIGIKFMLENGVNRGRPSKELYQSRFNALDGLL